MTQHCDLCSEHVTHHLCFNCSRENHERMERLRSDRNALLAVCKLEVIELANIAMAADPTATSELMTAVYDAIAKAEESS